MTNFDYQKLLKVYAETAGQIEGIFYYGKIKEFFPELTEEELDEIRRIETAPLKDFGFKDCLK
jgi:hypothetical protein